MIESQRQTARILLVEDNPVVMLNLSHLLHTAGLTVYEAVTGMEGLRLAREQNPDLVLLDVMLPDMNGVDLCRMIKADSATSGIFVVLLSSTETSSSRQVTGLEAGADGYIARPIENRELLARVQAMLRIQQTELALRRAHDELEKRVRERTAELSTANAALTAEIAVRQQAEKGQRLLAERLRVMSHRLVEVQEEERRFLARELHDEIGQVLTGLKVVLDLGGRAAPEPTRTCLGEASGMLDDLMERVRRLSLDLRPQILDDLGLLPALEWHFQRYEKQTKVRVVFQCSSLEGRLPAHLETAIYRIAQEALTNVARHARVQVVTVRLWTDEENLGLQVDDQGAGFDVEAALAARVSSGLSGMRERAALLGGEFTAESIPGSGTRLTVELPLRSAIQGHAERTEKVA